MTTRRTDRTLANHPPGMGAAVSMAARTLGRCGAFILACLLGQGAQAEAVAVPSGLDVAFHDIVRDTLGDGLTYRFRFLAPGIGEEGLDFPAVSADMDYLCTEYALSRVSNIGPQPNRIVISLMQQVVDFGVSSPEIVQFFESYSIQDDLCIWEAF